ncbi:TonB-dependent receptor [Rhizorhabdus sp.]|uniref:TonB-dependent receptor n=1 Tax=Rhizorhabdus sp. TaxID=1968843 RepID=UPI0035B0ADCF
MLKIRSVLLGSVAMLAFGGQGVQAQETPSGAVDGQQEITVTARRQSERLVDVPASVSVLTAENLRSSGIVTTEQAIAFTPGVTIVSNAAQVGDAQINIRGVNGARDAENNVALVVDGILKTNTAAINQYQGDLQQFEVLKGPQGAYYGRGATAGAFVLTTKKPGKTLEASGRGYLATQNGQLAEGSVSGPLSDTLGFVLFGQYRHTDGFYRNNGPTRDVQGKIVDNYRGWSLGGRLVYDPTDRLSIDMKARYGEVKAAALNFEAIFALPDFATGLNSPKFFEDVNDHTRFNYQRNIKNRDNQRTVEASIKADYEFDTAKLTGWVSYSDIDETLVGDASAASLGRFNNQPSCIASTAALFAAGVTLPAPLALGPTPAASLFGPFGPTTCDGIQVTVRDQKDISAEVRLVSTTDGPLSWSVGAYYLHINRHYGVAVNEDTGQGSLDTLYNPPGSINPTSQLFDDKLLTDAYAAFGSLQYKPTDKLTVSGALRYDREERKVEPLVPNVLDPVTGGPINPGFSVGSLVPKKKTYQLAQPKFTARYEVTPDVNLYVDYGVGFKAGGFNSQGSSAIIDQFFNQLLGSNLGVTDDYKKEKSNAIEAGFKLRLADGKLQIDGAVYRNIVRDMQFFEFYTGTFGLLRVVSNIDKVRLQGAELGVLYRPVRGVTLTVGGNVLDSKILRNSVRPDTVGNKSPYTADYTLNAGLQLEQPVSDTLDLTFKADYRLTGPTWFHVVQNQKRRTIFDVFFPGLGTGDYSKSQRDAYGILNLRAGVKSQNWRLTAFVNNVFKKRYLEEVIPAPEFGGSFSTPGQLRTIGVEAGFNF